MRRAARAVQAELLRLGLDTANLQPGELEWACSEIAAMARKRRISPVLAASRFAYIRATDDAIRASEAGEQPEGGTAG